MKDKLTVTISIDDVHPQAGWRILGDKTEKWLRSLNEKYGAKFACFVPTRYHRQYPRSHHFGWVQEVLSIPWVEISGHGHRHECDDKRYGECEFAELQHPDIVRERLQWMWAEWMMVQYLPDGWKNPGWLCSLASKEVIENSFKYVSLHYEHNQGMKWNCREFFGHDGIQEINIRTHNVSEQHPMGMIMLTSHIAGDWNHNVWNEDNFEQLCISLDYLIEKYDCEFKTLKECL